jgi:hypothetical protein
MRLLTSRVVTCAVAGAFVPVARRLFRKLHVWAFFGALLLSADLPPPIKEADQKKYFKS